MKISSSRILITAVLLLASSCGASASDYLKWPDGRRVLVVQPNEQIDLTRLQTGVRGTVTDRRFDTNAAMFLANEIYLSGTEFFLKASARQLPIAHDREFSYLTNVEAYWYSRYNLLSLTAHSRCGIGIVHGPYLELRAREATALNHFGRTRGELPVSNKDVMLTQEIASFLGRTGMPQKFENAVPLMLEFESCDARLVLPVDISQGSTGRAAYLDDFWSLRWDFDHMSRIIDMGGVAQAMLKKILWAKFFLRRNHTDDDFPGEVFLGNNAEDGFRGSMLTLESVTTMLMAKAAMFAAADGRTLGGIDPTTYRPEDGLRYLPHRINPELIYTTDMPVRHFDLSVKDPTSMLWDQASWLWATVEYFDLSNPRKRDNWDRVFGYQTPFDGSVMEQKYALLARSLANAVLANIVAMHTREGVLVSSWTPKDGPGEKVRTADLSLAMVALAAYVEMMDLEPEGRAKAEAMLRRQADFLLGAASADGSYREVHTVAAGAGSGDRSATAQAFAIRGLLAAFTATGESRYRDGALRTAATWIRDFWDEQAGLFRTIAGNDLVTYGPKDVAAILAAMREMALVEHHGDFLRRFKIFFVQSIDSSGLIQAEDIFTGEKIGAVRAGVEDSDGDGIPFIGSKAAHGMDAVFAARVEFDLGRGGARAVVVTESVRPRTGEAIFAANCAICHGEGGVGNEGPRLVDSAYVQLTGHAGVARTVASGRLGVGMPAWGGILSTDEIDAVVDYIRGLK